MTAEKNTGRNTGQGFGLGRSRPEVGEDLAARRAIGGTDRIALPDTGETPPSVGGTGPAQPAHDIRPQKSAPPPRRIVAPRPR